MYITAEASLYPLRTKNIDGPINRFCRNLKNLGLKIDTGDMSTIISGEAGKVFDGLKAAVTDVGEESDIVLVVKFSNACSSCAADEEKNLALF